MHISKRSTVVMLLAFFCALCVVIYNYDGSKTSEEQTIKVVSVPSMETSPTLPRKPQQPTSIPNNAPTESASRVAPPAKANPAHARQFLVVQDFIVDNTGTNPTWSRSSEERLRKLVSTIDHVKEVTKLHCGAYMCEVRLITANGLDEDVRNDIVESLAAPIYTNDKSQNFTVRQIFSNKDVGESVAGFIAFYQRTIP